MPEAEDVIADVAKHATVFARALWRRHRRGREQVVEPPGLDQFAERLDLLVCAVFGASYPLRIAQPPPPPTLFARLFRHQVRPRERQALPATDGQTLWLPKQLVGIVDPERAKARYRALVLQQAMRAQRGSALPALEEETPWTQDVYLVLEAQAADEEIAKILPGVTEALRALRTEALAARPPLAELSVARRPVERWLRELLETPLRAASVEGPEASLKRAREVAAKLLRSAPAGEERRHPLLRDQWTGELRAPPEAEISFFEGDQPEGEPPKGAPRTARLSRAPRERKASEDEDDKKQGVWMVQTSQPHEKAEDPMGLQRPVDRDQQTASESFAEDLAELSEARRVSTPGKPKEIFLSDDPLPSRSRQPGGSPEGGDAYAYPEWDYRLESYRKPGARVRILPALPGPQKWVDDTLKKHRSILHLIRRRFEMLRGERSRLRRQLDGEEPDLAAYVESQADFRAGLHLAQRVYQTERRARRSLALTLLIDVSGSTDSWISGNRRVIDVEREALLLVCIALDGLQEPYSVLAYSGEGPNGVTVRELKAFDERHDNEVSLRIAALEPEHYTRSGAAIRHATALLMKEQATHRMLLLLSDGKPNDVDDYEGRYGVEDMRQAINESKLQGVFPFCLTIDVRAASYLPHVFGPHRYALLPRPELLPTVLLDWMKRLLSQ